MNPWAWLSWVAAICLALVLCTFAAVIFTVAVREMFGRGKHAAKKGQQDDVSSVHEG